MVSKLLPSTTKALLLCALAVSASLSVSSAGATPVACNPAACALQPSGAAARVCGSNGITYDSQCELELAKCASPQLQVVSHGACIVKCDQKCSNHEALICGSDGITYLNACHFDRAYCMNKELIPVGYGACAKKTTSSTVSLRS